MITTGIVFLALAASSVATPFARQTKTNGPPAGYVAVGPASPEVTIPLTLALPASNTDGLHAALLDVSDPKSANYGKYLSKAEVEQFVAPKPESVQAVNDWLQKSNLKAEVISPSGDMLRVNIPVETANKLLSGNFTKFVNHAINDTVIRTLSYIVPPDVQEHLSFIYPTSQFIPPAVGKPRFEAVQASSGVKMVASNASIPAECNSEITPACLQALYNIPDFPASAPGNNIYVPGYLGEFATQSDLQEFTSAYRPGYTNATFGVVSVDDGPTSGEGSFEASLDIQYTAGLATNVPTTFVSIGDASVQGFLDFVNYLLGLPELPLVVTTSYGFWEEDFSGSNVQIAQAFCDAYAQLGLRGTTVLFASGDGGVSGVQPNSGCDDGSAFLPSFPSGCPFITSVGGTTGVNSEVGAELSGGGFSNIFPRPTYQNASVLEYLDFLGDEYAGRYNQTGRAFPDVAAQAENFIVVVEGTFWLVSGTSAASPTFASVLAMVNDIRILQGRPSLGFVNPLLYYSTWAFNDITSGSNPGCGTSGFPATTGWDPVTGLGSPNYFNFLEFEF